MRWYELDPSYWLYYAADWCRDELPGTRTGAVGIAFFELCAELWPWVAAGAALSALASHYLPRTRLGALLSRHRGGSVAGASLLGLVSPLCTFAAIPVASRIMGAGVPAPPLMAFLFASPLMNPALFVYTLGALGLEMAVARTVTALAIGLAAGFGTAALQARGWLAGLGTVPHAVAGGSAAAAPAPGLWRRFARDLSFISPVVRPRHLPGRPRLDLPHPGDDPRRPRRREPLVGAGRGGPRRASLRLRRGRHPHRRDDGAHGHVAGRGPGLLHRRPGDQAPHRGHPRRRLRGAASSRGTSWSCSWGPSSADPCTHSTSR